MRAAASAPVRRWALALLAGIVAFAGSFAIARAVTDDGDAASAMPTRQLPEQPVMINNLERAPTIKPLRSVAGAPPAAAEAQESP